jgi:hypothetical protein
MKLNRRTWWYAVVNRLRTEFTYGEIIKLQALRYRTKVIARRLPVISEINPRLIRFLDIVASTPKLAFDESDPLQTAAGRRELLAKSLRVADVLT